MERIFQSLFCTCARFFYAASYKGIPAWAAYWQRTLPPAEKLHEILRNYYSFVNISTLHLTLLKLVIQYKCNENYIYVHTLETEYQHIKNYFVKGVVFMMMVPRKRNEFDLFRDFFEGDDFFPIRRESAIMKTDIKEKKDKYIIEMDLPGYEKENINLSLKDGYLEVTAEVNKEDENEEKDKFVHKERYYGHCSRSFYVGEQIKEEDVNAEFKNGILKICIPKKEERKELPEAKHIEIK